MPAVATIRPTGATGAAGPSRATDGWGDAFAIVPRHAQTAAATFAALTAVAVEHGVTTTATGAARRECVAAVAGALATGTAVAAVAANGPTLSAVAAGTPYRAETATRAAVPSVTAVADRPAVPAVSATSRSEV